MISRVVLMFSAMTLLLGVTLAQTIVGYCHIASTTGNTPMGRISWIKDAQGLGTGYSFTFDNLRGMGANSTRGFHAHVWGAIFSQNGVAVGGHFDPAATATHANLVDGLAPSAHHAGDFGNVTSDQNGVAFPAQIPVTFTEISDTDGERSLHGRALIIHRDPDLGVAFNLTLGNAGPRIGQCVMQALSSPSVPASLQWGAAELKVDIHSPSSQGRLSLMNNGDGTANIRARVCGLPSNVTVSIVFGSYSDVMDNSTFLSVSSVVFPIQANVNGVVDANLNTTVSLPLSSMIARPVAILNSNVVIMRGVVGIFNMPVPLNAPVPQAVPPVIQTCEPVAPPQPQPTTKPPGPTPGNTNALFMISTTMLIIASLLLF